MTKITKVKGGITRQGKGSFPRIDFMSDPEYKKNFDRIFRKPKKSAE